MSNKSVFKSIVGVSSEAFQPFGWHQIQRDSEQFGAFDFVSFPTPRDVLVSRWYPGYRVTDLTGVSADEALALTLGATMESLDDLQRFQRILATPDIAADIIAKLLPRNGVPVKSRAYLMTEKMVSETVKEIVKQKVAGVDDAIIMAYNHAILRVLTAKDLVAPGPESRVVNQAKSYAIDATSLRQVIMTEAMRGVFSESRVASVIKYLDQEATPQIFGEQLGEMFRQFSRSIPEIQLRLKQFDTVVQVLHAMNVNPTDVPEELRAHPALLSLLSISNFTLYAADNPLRDANMPGDAIEEIRRAADAVLTVVQSAPSIESLPLSKFAELFGEVPVSSPDGLRRGLVLYTSQGQSSKMDVADVWPRAGGFALSQLDPSYVRAAGVAAPLTGSMLSVDAVKGLANIVADEAAMIPQDEPGFITPELYMIGVTGVDLMYLAMARAASVSYVRIDNTNDQRGLPLLFGCSVAEQWRMDVLAATPTTAYFTDPAAVIMYTSKMTPKDAKPLPARSQTLGLQMNRDIAYIGSNIESLLVKTVEETFSFKITVQPYGQDAIPLNLKINVLEGLVGTEAKPINRGEAYYAAVREPGVDTEIETLLRLALAYASSDDQDINGDKAKSWLIVHLAPIMMHPAVRLIAERAINAAVIEQKLDARALRPQMREVYSRAFFGVALAILNRFGKIDGTTASALTKAIPTSALSLQAALTLAQLPAAINGTR